MIWHAASLHDLAATSLEEERERERWAVKNKTNL